MRVDCTPDKRTRQVRQGKHARDNACVLCEFRGRRALGQHDHNHGVCAAAADTLEGTEADTRSTVRLCPYRETKVRK